MTLGRFVMPLVAVPQRYPFDWYAMSGEVGVSNPNLSSLYY
ncbi:MAG TPA: hypothetical protein VNY52_12920 [Solirubrobacteraceae bacterium]|nr:hypothetical protein [Solirubrobacteraceae bacterium]